MYNVIKVADAANVVVNGYAFTVDGENVKVLNLNQPFRAAYISKNGVVLETSMDDIELEIIQDYYKRNCKYLEV